MTNRYNLEDSYLNRVMKVNNNFVIMKVDNTAPILITNTPAIQDNLTMFRTFNSENIKEQVLDIDTTIKDRFINIGRIKSPLTMNKIDLYYDKIYQDIIITPDLSYYTLTQNAVYEITGYRLGNSNGAHTYNVFNMLGTDESSRVLLNETNANVALKSYLITITGTSPANTGHNDKFEELLNNVYNINHNSRRPSVLLELGTTAALFKQDPGLLDVHLLGQLMIKDYGIQHVGKQKTGNNKLYLHIQF